MHSQLIYLILLSAVTGVGGLALGGLLALLLKRESPKGTSLLLSFTAGLMLCIVCFDMVPEAVNKISSLIKGDGKEEDPIVKEAAEKKTEEKF